MNISNKRKRRWNPKYQSSLRSTYKVTGMRLGITIYDECGNWITTKMLDDNKE